MKNAAGIKSVDHWVKLTWAALLSAVTLLAFAPLAMAAPQGPWLLPASILSASGQDAQGAEITTAPDGTTTAVWGRSNGSENIIQASTRPAGGSFGAPVDLSATGRDAFGPQISTAPDGTTTVVWWRSNGSSLIIQAATRPPGGSFGAPVNLSASGGDALSAEIATAPDGTTTVDWERIAGGTSTVQAATRPPGGSFGAPVDLSATGGQNDSSQITSAPDGTFTAVWHHLVGSTFVIQAATRPPAGSFGTPVDLSVAGFTAETPQITTAANGTTTVVWSRVNGSNFIVQAATRPSGGSFGAPVDLSTTGQSAEDPQITTAPDGTTTAVWRRSNGSNKIVQAATRPPGGFFGVPAELSAAGHDAGEPEITTAPDGTATAVWYRSNGSNDIIQAATRPPSGSFGVPVDLSATGQSAEDPQITTAPDGTTTAVWNRYDSAKVIQSASTTQPSFSLGVTKSGSGTVTSSPAEIDCGAACSQTYLSFTKVTLTATPDPGNTFTGWGGACAGKTGTTCELTMLADQNVTASFKPAGKAKLKVTKLKPAKPKVKRGKKVRIKVTAKNIGHTTATSAKLCLKVTKSVKKNLKPSGKTCQKLGSLKPGKSGTGVFRLKATAKAKKGKKYKVTFTLSGKGAKTASRAVKVTVK